MIIKKKKLPGGVEGGGGLRHKQRGDGLHGNGLDISWEGHDALDVLCGG